MTKKSNLSILIDITFFVVAAILCVFIFETEMHPLFALLLLSSLIALSVCIGILRGIEMSREMVLRELKEKVGL